MFFFYYFFIYFDTLQNLLISLVNLFFEISFVGTLSDEQKAAAAGAKLGFTVSMTANALAVKYNAVGGGNFAVKLKPGVPVVAGDATDEQTDTVSTQHLIG